MRVENTLCEARVSREREREGWSLKEKRRKKHLEGAHFPRRGWNANQRASSIVLVGLCNIDLLGCMERISACISKQIRYFKCWVKFCSGSYYTCSLPNIQFEDRTVMCLLLYWVVQQQISDNLLVQFSRSLG